MKKFEETRTNLKELGSDLKALGASSVCLVTDTVRLPMSFCRDIRNAYLRKKAINEYLKTHKVVVLEEPKEAEKPANLANATA